MDKSGIASLGPYVLRFATDKLFAANDVAAEIENMYPMPEGCLRSVWGPAALVDNVNTVLNTATRPTATSSSSAMDVGATTYGTIKYGSRMHGIYHALLDEGVRDVLLLHTNDELWEFHGWNRGWQRLLASTKPTYGLEANLVDTDNPQFPTQFESTASGIVIVPQDNRAFFYDGTVIAPLGFTEVPGPVTGHGPSSSKSSVTQRGAGVNDENYAHDGTPFLTTRNNYAVGMDQGFGDCRIGTVEPLTFDSAVFLTTDDGVALTSGWLLPAEFRCRSQFVDRFGNLSAMSPPSDVVSFDFQPSKIPKPNNTTNGDTVNVGSLKKQIAWTNISVGPDHCVGRRLYRTKDLLNSESSDYFRHTINTMGVAGAYSTLPDNQTQMYPDNIPDSLLVVPAKEIDPVPIFKLCRLAFGRLWVANVRGQPGQIRPSLQGYYGTFPSGEELYPDPAGGEITGMWRANRGLLVFTRTGTFVVEPSDDGLRFKSSVLSSQVGCEAPSSLATLDDGRTIWLGRDGFYTYDGSTISFVSQELREFFHQVSFPRMKQAVAVYDVTTEEYRCWLSTNASSTNNMCLVYTGGGWRKRTDTEAESACITQDHRKYCLVAGKLGGDSDTVAGVYVVDHAGNAQDEGLQNVIDVRESMIETVWMQNQDSLKKSTPKVINLWLRETENSSLNIEVLRDWRETTVETATVKRYSGSDVPNFYAGTRLGDPNVKFVRRRPYWTRAQIYVPSAGTFKFRIKGVGDWEFVGIQTEVTPQDYGGAQTPP